MIAPALHPSRRGPMSSIRMLGHIRPLIRHVSVRPSALRSFSKTYRASPSPMRYTTRPVSLIRGPQPSRLATTLVIPDSKPPPAPEVYTPPTTGILSYLPSSVVPYAELVRIDKPTGTIYLFLPCMWSTILASTMVDPVHPLTSVVYTTLLFGTGAIIMRGAGCAINDLWDRNIDPKVTRTKFRPIARGAITPAAALAFTASQCLAGLVVLLQFPVETIVYGIPSLVLVGCYPLMKRITHYPQFVLGLSFSWGAILGFPAMGLSLMEPTVAITAGLLYASNVAWTVLYDTIYAHQDVKDDLKAGVKSIAVKHESHTKYLMTGLGVVQIGLLAGAGAVSGCGPIFYGLSCGGAAAGLGYMIRKVNLKNVKECWWWFKWCAWAVGGVAVGGGLFGEYLAVRMGIYGEEGWWGMGGRRQRTLGINTGEVILMIRE
ncbi:UbiA prenyltransferase family-domain-containing protein [Morchella snyderi]|nr:UbiA prenyltransferase family-domain-containing protein [Morchella snyderi]